MEKMSILPILQKIPLFAELNEKNHQAIINSINLEYYPAGHLLLKEGEEGQAMYILRSGKVKVFSGQKDNERQIAVLGANDFCGEMSLISDHPRNASAITLEDTEVFALKKDDFKEFLATNQTTATIITKEFLDRVKANEEEKNK